MPKQKIQKKNKNSKLILVLAVAAGLGVIFAVAGFGFAATMEQKDSFCASCHTQPETTFFERSTAAKPVDLASFHTIKQTRCIDCHSGAGVPGRVSAELLGAHNALLWYSGTAVQPAKLTSPIKDENCLKCHQQVPQTQDFNTHFHYYLSRWQASDPNAATCVSCHSSHDMDVNTGQKYLNVTKVENVCQSCHNALGGGG